VTKGVSNVTGCKGPLLQDVIRSRKDKDLITFLERILEERAGDCASASGITHQSHPGQNHPEGSQRQAPFGGLVD